MPTRRARIAVALAAALYAAAIAFVVDYRMGGYISDFDPLWQPLFQGVVLLLAVSLGSARLFQVRNRLDLFS